jgi:hypothetical protein
MRTSDLTRQNKVQNQGTRFGVTTIVAVHIVVFWVVTPCLVGDTDIQEAGDTFVFTV